MNNVQYGWHMMKAEYENDDIGFLQGDLMLVKITPDLLEDIEYVRSNLTMLINDHPRGGYGTLEFYPVGMRMELLKVPFEEEILPEKRVRDVLDGEVDMALLEPDGGIPDRLVEIQKTEDIFTSCECIGFKVTAGTAVHSSDLTFTCVLKHVDSWVDSPSMGKVFFNE